MSKTTVARAFATLKTLRWPIVFILLIMIAARVAVGPVSRRYLEEAIHDAVGTRTRVGKVEVDWIGGEATAFDVRIASPVSFEGDCLTFSTLSSPASLHSFSAQNAEIEELTISRIRVHLELANGRLNLTQLIRQVAARQAEDDGGRRLRIKKITVENLVAGLSDDPSFETVAASLSLESDGEALRPIDWIARLLDSIAASLEQENSDHLPGAIVDRLKALNESES